MADIVLDSPGTRSHRRRFAKTDYDRFETNVQDGLDVLAYRDLLRAVR